MNKKTVSGIMLILLLSVMIIIPFVRAPGIYWYDSVFVEPEAVQVYVGEYVVIDVSFDYGFDPPHPPVIEFSLDWDASLLELIGWESVWDSPMVVVGDNYLRVSVANPFYDTPLIGVAFKTKAVGSTILDLFDSNVYTVDGYVGILPRPPLPLAIHNIDTGLSYTTIQEAINAPETLGGHTILVDAGTYFEQVVMNKSISLIGEDKYNTFIDGSREGTVIYVSASNVTIAGFTIQNSGNMGSDSGMYVYESSFNSISNNIVRYNKIGFRLDWSNNNSIMGNTASNNEYGIHLEYHSSNNIIEGNIAENNQGGISIFGYAENNVIVGNNITSNAEGVTITASNNQIIGNDIWSNGADGILLLSHAIETNNNFVAGNNVSNSPFGIRVYGSNHIIYGNNVSHNNEGIWVYDSDLNNITSNIVSNNEYGIVLLYYSKDNILVGNIASNNRDGIRLTQCCTNNTLIDNTVSSNTKNGIRLWDSRNNVLTGNNILNNSNGILVKSNSNNNVFFHNNFIDNTQQVTSDGPLNSWDDGYPSGGNYWSNYTGIDLRSGAYQNETGSDGIGDTPYIIDDYNQDNYPLMSPYEYWSNPILGDINKDMKVDNRDLFQFTVAYGSTPEKSNWNPHADLNNDDLVGCKDLLILGTNYGKEEAYP